MTSIRQTVTVSSDTAASASIRNLWQYAAVDKLFNVAKKALFAMDMDDEDMEAMFDMLDSVLQGKTLTKEMIDELHHVVQDHVALFYKLHDLLKKDDSEDFEQFIEYAQFSIKAERRHLHLHVIDHLSVAIAQSTFKERTELLAARYRIVRDEPLELDKVPDKWQEEVQAFKMKHDQLKRNSEELFKCFIAYLSTTIDHEWKYIRNDDGSPAKKQKKV